ncbi:MAG: ABC transporter permease [Opitutaceae bacterium]|nr:ABC transporter permease [Opitutaceae bacterium]
MLLDFRYALRQLAKSPGYAAVVVLTLAFGIAVNTTIFGMIGAFFLQRLPVPESDRLVLLLQRSQAWNAPHSVSFPDFKDYRERLRGVETLIAYMPMPAHLSPGTGAPQRAWLEVVTPNAYDALGVTALHGRMLLPSDGESAGAAPVIVLTYSCWTQRFGSDPAVVGRTIRLNNHPFTVVGVATEKFTGLSPFMAVHGFVPTGALDSLKTNGAGFLEWRNASMWRVLGKMRPEATLDSVRAEAEVITRQLAQEYPDSHLDVSSTVIPEHRGRPDPSVADYLPVFAALFLGQVILVLGIACANVANLMFARAATRQKELTVRAALGANRARLVRQMLLESLVLAAIAGVVGWLLADWSAPLFARLSAQGDIPVNTNPGSLWPQRLFTVVISLAAGIGSGLLPALRASRIDLSSQLKEGAGAGAAPGRHRLRDMFVINQVVFSLVVLVFAGLFTRSLHRARTVDIGFRHERLLLASFDLSLQGYPEEKARLFCQQALERARALPGVEEATLTSFVPFDYNLSLRDIFPVDATLPSTQTAVSVGYATVAPGYEAMLGLRALAGRALADSDTATTAPVAVINAALAERCWPGRDALGRRFRPWKDGPLIEVVGIVATTKSMMLSEAPRPFYYTPLGQKFDGSANLLVRAKGDPAALANSLRTSLGELDPHLPIYGVRTMEELMANSIFAFMPLRMGAVLAAVQGVIGLGLAVLGLYAVVSFGVTQRARELGIRMALGATGGTLVREVVRSGMKLALKGAATGLVFSVVLGFALSKVLFGMQPVDPLTLVGGTVLLLAVATFACWLPARRATRIDPAIVLRTE